MIKSLQKKFVVTAMAAVTVLLTVLLGLLNVGNVVITGRQSDSLLEVLARNEISVPPKGPERPKDHGNIFDPPVTEDRKMAAVFFTVQLDGNGQIVRIDTSRIASVTEEEAAEIVRSVIADAGGRKGHFKYRGIAEQNQPGMVYVFLDTSSDTASILRVLLLSGVIGLVCWGLMLLLVILLSRKAIRPIAASIERQKQFVTDAGHEIKTPLAIILSNTDAMELYNGENKWSRNIRIQTQRLNGLMQNLLMLSRFDEENQKVTKEDVWIGRLVKETAGMFQETAEQRGLTIETSIDAEAVVSSNGELMAQLISILLDNAVKYARENSEIVMKLTSDGRDAVLTFTNECDHLPDCPSEKLFDRFYRGDAARTRMGREGLKRMSAGSPEAGRNGVKGIPVGSPGAGGGYGIGLSAARAIAELCGCQLWAEYQETNTISFHLRFDF